MLTQLSVSLSLSSTTQTNAKYDTSVRPEHHHGRAAPNIHHWSREYIPLPIPPALIWYHKAKAMYSSGRKLKARSFPGR